MIVATVADFDKLSQCIEAVEDLTVADFYELIEACKYAGKENAVINEALVEAFNDDVLVEYLEATYGE